MPKSRKSSAKRKSYKGNRKVSKKTSKRSKRRSRKPSRKSRNDLSSSEVASMRSIIDSPMNGNKLTVDVSNGQQAPMNHGNQVMYSPSKVDMMHVNTAGTVQGDLSNFANMGVGQPQLLSPGSMVNGMNASTTSHVQGLQNFANMGAPSLVPSPTATAMGPQVMSPQAPMMSAQAPVQGLSNFVNFNGADLVPELRTNTATATSPVAPAQALTNQITSQLQNGGLANFTNFSVPELTGGSRTVCAYCNGKGCSHCNGTGHH